MFKRLSIVCNPTKHLKRHVNDDFTNARRVKDDEPQQQILEAVFWYRIPCDNKNTTNITDKIVSSLCWMISPSLIKKVGFHCLIVIRNIYPKRLSQSSHMCCVSWLSLTVHWVDKVSPTIRTVLQANEFWGLHTGTLIAIATLQITWKKGQMCVYVFLCVCIYIKNTLVLDQYSESGDTQSRGI